MPPENGMRPVHPGEILREELAGSLKRRVEDVEIRIPKSTAIRQDLHAVRRAAGPTGAPRLVATEDTDGHADRFWAAALACGAAETEPAVYELHRVNNHADLRGRPKPRAAGGGAVAGDGRGAVVHFVGAEPLRWPTSRDQLEIQRLGSLDGLAGNGREGLGCQMKPLAQLRRPDAETVPCDPEGARQPFRPNEFGLAGLSLQPPPSRHVLIAPPVEDRVD